MSLESLNRTMLAAKAGGEPVTPKGKSLADALGGKVGNLQAMLSTVKTVPKENAPAMLVKVFGIDITVAEEVVALLSRDVKEVKREKTVINARAEVVEEQKDKSSLTPRVERPYVAYAKVIKKAAGICEMLEGATKERAAKVIEEALEANMRIYDKDTQRLVEVPDHRMRMAAAALLLAYVEGLPVQRAISAHVKIETAEDVMRKLEGSPAALAAIAGLGNAGMKLEVAGEILDANEVVRKITSGSTQGSSETSQGEEGSE